MQVLKDSVRKRIIKSARKEFQKFGFDKSSMRAIALSGEMTVGNLYRYYKNKEDLYKAIVGDLFDELDKLKSDLPSASLAKIKYLLENVARLQNLYRAEWLILFGGSHGSKYAKVAQEIRIIFRDVLKDVLKTQKVRVELAVPLTSALIDGLNTILRTEKNNSSKLAEDFLEYMKSNILNL